MKGGGVCFKSDRLEENSDLGLLCKTYSNPKRLG
jgi:hypothetical protein